jgi:hypothetical protein
MNTLHPPFDVDFAQTPIRDFRIPSTLGINLHKIRSFENPDGTGIVFLGFAFNSDSLYSAPVYVEGSLPVRVEITDRAIDIKVFPQRIQSTWTLVEGFPSEQNRYEVVVSDELHISHWDMDSAPQLKSRREWSSSDGKDSVEWEVEYRQYADMPIERLGDLGRATSWLSKEAKKLTDPASTYRTIATQLKTQRKNERSRFKFEQKYRENNRAMVLDDCFSEILRAEREIDEASGGDYGSWLPDLSTKQRIAFQAAVYSIAMGEDYPRGGWEGKIRGEIAEPFSKFTVKGVGYDCPEALEYNAHHGGGILCNMWNVMAESPNRAIIADAANLLIEAVDMKAVHDASKKKWFGLVVENVAHEEDAKRVHIHHQIGGAA